MFLVYWIARVAGKAPAITKACQTLCVAMGTHIYDQVLHRKRPGQKGDVIAEFVLILERGMEKKTLQNLLFHQCNQNLCKLLPDCLYNNENAPA